MLMWKKRNLLIQGNRLQIIQSNSEWDMVLVEDVDSDCSSEDTGDLVDVCQHSLEPLSYVKFNGGSSYKGSFR